MSIGTGCFSLSLAVGAAVLLTTTLSLAAPPAELAREKFQREVDGKKVDLYTLRNGRGMVVKITNWGARVIQILVPDKKGRIGDVALGYDTFEALQAGQGSMGAFIGRYANRIRNATFTLNGQQHKLAANSAPNSLHGGLKGSRFVVFDAEVIDEATVQMTYTFKDGEESFPGTLPLRVRYSVTPQNALRIEYDAVAVDKPTVVNFTSHIFWNLAGHDKGDVLGHLLQVNGEAFLPIDKTGINTGEIRPVKGTPLDFTRPRTFGERIAADDEQLRFGPGYDHHYVLTKKHPSALTLAARISEPTSGRLLEVWSTEPGLQVYSGNFLEGKRPRDIGKGGAVYAKHTGFCLEPSHFPDSVNKPQFPSTVLNPGQWYSGTIVYKLALTK